MGAAGFGEREIAGVGHAEGLEDVLLGVDVEGLAGEGFDDVAEEDEVDVGVLEVVAGGGFEGGGEGAVDAFGFVWGGEAPRVAEVDVGGFAGGMGEKHAEGDEGAGGVVVGVEGGEVALDGVVEAGDLALLVELHDGRGGGEALAEGGHVEDGVFGHGLGGGGLAVEAGFTGELAEAVGLLEDDGTVVADEDDGSWGAVGGDGGVEKGGDGAEVGGGGGRRLCGCGEADSLRE